MKSPDEAVREALNKGRRVRITKGQGAAILHRNLGQQIVVRVDPDLLRRLRDEKPDGTVLGYAILRCPTCGRVDDPPVTWVVDGDKRGDSWP